MPAASVGCIEKGKVVVLVEVEVVAEEMMSRAARGRVRANLLGVLGVLEGMERPW